MSADLQAPTIKDWHKEKSNYMDIVDDDLMAAVFKCKLCSKKFTREYTLRMHIFVHFDIKEYECDVCHKRFAFKQYLREHRYIHTGERPYKCPYPGCDMRFRQRGKLSVHRKEHRIRLHNKKKLAYAASHPNSNPDDCKFEEEEFDDDRVFAIQIGTVDDLIPHMVKDNNMAPFVEGHVLPVPKKLQAMGIQVTTRVGHVPLQAANSLNYPYSTNFASCCNSMATTTKTTPKLSAPINSFYRGNISFCSM
eukprot:CAMPEP_0114988180 /NCGR_PEP_ID=MMETSP0216-20121206/9448_1 /TAXON_ID=223996 /ORGANISM="Protocruzia adherens, Strain Boccale" /LENGTH=249 /DNA_ID=CAMNT_0002350917 /DNA_START=162 /DNA_END=911 /DNA_ORIENTATION=-